MSPPKDAYSPRCYLCRKYKPDLLRCSACKAVTYCDQEHQRADWATHRAKCTIIKRAYKKLDHEETALRNPPPDSLLPENIFESCIGDFWGIHQTRPYMRARYDVAYQLQQLTSRAAIKESLGHLMGMLGLCRADNMAVRDFVPGLYLRMKKDQEAYDFMKWYATVPSNYNWDNMKLPYLDLEDEDALEDMGFFKDAYQVAPILAMALIKVRMLLDLTDVKNSPSNSSDIKSQRSGIWKKRPEILLETNKLTGRISKLKKEVGTLFEMVNGENQNVWNFLLSHKLYMREHVDGYGLGGPDEAIYMLQAGGRAWIETEGAIELIREMKPDPR